MKESKSTRTKILKCRLTPAEYEKLEKKCKASTCNKISDYVRRNLFDKNIVTTYRNASLDDFMGEMIRLRSELNAVGNNFNQAVKKLHTLNHIPEFRNWIISYELEKKILLNKVDEVKNHINKIADKWLL